MKSLARLLVLGVAALLQATGVAQVLVPPFDKSPCWVSIFDGKDFMPPAAHLTGPNFLEKPRTQPGVTPDLRNVGGQDFIDRVDSLIVGPRAHITVYDQVNFSGERLSFGPGERVPNLAVLGFDNRIKSIKVGCE